MDQSASIYAILCIDTILLANLYVENRFVAASNAVGIRILLVYS